ncbi:MAG: hypothetical protein JZU65_05400 [Chlorobium sp.]|nr:hypothetical protein [Chlorobium sp.]
MWNTPTSGRLAKIPKLHETESVSLLDKLIHLHFFIGSHDWFIAEYDGQDTFWGFAILSGDYQNAEWGYVSFSELQSISFKGVEIDCELEEFWEVRPASQVTSIAMAQCLQMPV